MRTRREMVPSPRARSVAWLAGALAIFAALLALLVPHAVPVFQQDWAWPLTGAQGGQMARVSASIWRDSGFGSPWNAPNSWTIGVSLGAACAAFGPYVTLVAFIAALVACELACASLLFRACGTTRAGAAAGAILYAASPVFLNKLHAGHTYYLVGYALVPGACYALLRSARGSRGFGFLAGALLALCAGQFQFFEIAAIALGLTAFVVVGPRNAARPFAFALLVGAIAHAPDYRIMADAARNVLFFPELPTALFENALSTPVPDALAMLAYVGGYASGAFGPLAPFATLAVDAAIGVAVLCALASARASGSPALSRAALLGCALAALGAALTAGYDGPLGGPLRWSFAHVALATAFREFYHQAELTALGTSLVAAVAVGARQRLVRIAAVAATLVLAGIFACAIVRAPVRASAGENAALARVVSSVPGRTLYTPGSASLGAVGTTTFGTDSFSFSSGASSPVTYSSDPMRTAFWFASRGNAIERVAARFGWTAIARRPGIADRYVAMLDNESRARLARNRISDVTNGIRVDASRTRASLRDVIVTNDVASGVPTWPNVARLAAERHLISPVPERAPPFDLATLSTDPLVGIVQSERYLPALRPLACLPLPSFFRYRTRAGASATTCDWTYRSVAGDDCLRLDTVDFSARGPCTNRSRGLAYANAVAARIRRGDERLAFVRQSFDARWRLACDGDAPRAPDVLVDAYASGWRVRDCRNPRASYAPDETFHAFARYGAVLLTVLLALDLAGFGATGRGTRTRAGRA